MVTTPTTRNGWFQMVMLRPTALLFPEQPLGGDDTQHDHLSARDCSLALKKRPSSNPGATDQRQLQVGAVQPGEQGWTGVIGVLDMDVLVQSFRHVLHAAMAPIASASAAVSVDADRAGSRSSRRCNAMG